MVRFIKSPLGYFKFHICYWALGFAVLGITIKIFTKILKTGNVVSWGLFSNSFFISGFLIVLFFYLALIIASINWAQILKIPASFIFLILPFLLYFFLLFNTLLFHFNSIFILRMIILFIILGPLAMRERILNIKIGRIGWKDFLVIIFLAQAVLLFISQNFKADRLPYADEESFWYSAARVMLDHGFLASHQWGYGGGGLHPLGIPFLNALPALASGWYSTSTLFLMPVYIICGLAMFLFEYSRTITKNATWSLLFFLIAWFASFNNRSWPGSLFYAMIYGESVSMILVLSLLSCLASINTNRLPSSWGILSFLVGLLVLTKFPLIIFSVPFFITLLFFAWKTSRSIKKMAAMTIMFSLPFVILKLFQLKYGVNLASLGSDSIQLLFKRLLFPNYDMLSSVLANILKDANNLWYYSCISAGLSLLFRKYWRYAWTIGLWIVFLIIYYGYFYAYGSQGDYASGLRYFLPAGVGMLFVGACAFSDLTDFIYRQKNSWLKAFLYTGTLGILLIPIF